MKSEKMRDLGDRTATQRVMTEALTKGRLGIRIAPPKNSGMVHVEMTMEQALEEIEAYIESSYDIFANPLPHLRDFFPTFEWKFIKPSNKEEAVKSIIEADYGWLTGGHFLDWSCGIVTARRRHQQGSPFRIVYYPADESLELIDAAWPVQELKAEWCRIVAVNKFV